MPVWYLLHALRSVMATFGFASVNNPIAVTDKAKGTIVLCPDPELTLFFNFLKRYRRELSIATLPDSLRPLVHEPSLL